MGQIQSNLIATITPQIQNSISFDNLCKLNESTNINYIDEKSFTDYLNIPDEIGAGPLIYRSFINLGNYPSSSINHNLTYNGLIKAVAIYCDKFKEVITEDRLKLIFDSFSTPLDHNNNSNNDCANNRSSVSSETPSQTSSTTISKDDDDFLKLYDVDQSDEDNSPKVQSQDLVKVLTALVWIMSSEMSLTTASEESTNKLISLQNINQIRDAIVPIVDHMSRYNNKSFEPNKESTKSSSDITWLIFKKFIERNLPNIFHGFTRFFYNRFLIGQTLSRRTEIVYYWPTLDHQSEILDPIDMAILSWMLPDKAMKKRVWNRLFIGSLHGFSMNCFSNRLFKYPGPTLILIQAIITNQQTLFSTTLTAKKTTTKIENNNENSSESESQQQTLLLGAYVAEPWRTTNLPKACFGSDEFFLFEIWPTLEVFPATKKNTRYAYYNPSFGIGFGGLATAGQGSSKIVSPDLNSFVLQLDNSLQFGRYRNDMLRELSPTYSLSNTRGYFDISFEVLDIEVIGLGSSGALDKQRKEWKWEDNVTKRQHGHRRNYIDIEILKLAGIIDEESRREIPRKSLTL
ncbi:9459_t:CDS:2 [Entrophospora sp. SA101]|nr:9459_t:CDS:2 [Entrophospora sp. SA101]